VTEYAGTSSIMDGLIDYPERFGDLAELRSINDPVEYVEYLLTRGFDSFLPSTGRVLGGPLLSALQEQLPVPAGLLAELNESGQGPAGYYVSMRSWLDYDRPERPELYKDLDLEFSPVDLTALLDERVVQPTLAAGALFRDNEYMTRLFTTMSPNEMTRDPVFSFNPDLPEVSNIHQGKLTYYCGRIDEDSPTETPAVITTENGWELVLPDGPGSNPWTDQQWPQSQFIQVVREEGEAESVVDNTDAIAAYIAARGLELPGEDGERPHRDQDGGCSVGGGGASSAAGLGLAALAALFLLRRRRHV
jgi:MYXO-CTERM domain-containing protein